MLKEKCICTKRKQYRKLVRCAPTTARFFFADGTSKYVRNWQGVMENSTHEEIVSTAVGLYNDSVRYDERIERVKLISVDGKKVNLILTGE